MTPDITTLTPDQLKDLIAAANEQLANVTALPVAITARVEFDSYNERRYSRPWIAHIATWPVGGKAEYRWGQYLGTAAGGTCEVACHVGDVIAYGQKDGRGNGTSKTYAAIAADGRLYRLSEATAASYVRIGLVERLERLAAWEQLRSQKQVLIGQREALLDEWRKDTNNRAPYLQANHIDQQIKAITYDL